MRRPPARAPPTPSFQLKRPRRPPGPTRRSQLLERLNIAGGEGEGVLGEARRLFNERLHVVPVVELDLRQEHAGLGRLCPGSDVVWRDLEGGVEIVAGTSDGLRMSRRSLPRDRPAEQRRRTRSGTPRDRSGRSLPPARRSRPPAERAPALRQGLSGSVPRPRASPLPPRTSFAS